MKLGARYNNLVIWFSYDIAMEVYSSVGVIGMPSSPRAFSIWNPTKNEAIVIFT